MAALASAESVRTVDEIVSLATTEAERLGLGAMDALHLAAAYLGHCDEFITTERPTAAVYRSKLVSVIPLFP